MPSSPPCSSLYRSSTTPHGNSGLGVTCHKEEEEEEEEEEAVILTRKRRGIGRRGDCEDEEEVEE